MRTTIDAAGRVVIPKALRDKVGLVAGEVDLSVEGAVVRLQPIAGEGIVAKRGRMVIPDGPPVSNSDVQRLRRDDQR